MKNNIDKYMMKIIKSRRSIRFFNKKFISDEVIRSLIDAARWAPCPNNMQPWRFYLVRRNNIVNARVVEYLKKRSKTRSIAISIFLNDAIRVLKSCDAVLYVFNTRIVKNRYKRMVSKYYQKKANLFENQSIAASIENMMLYAETIGIGGVWLGSPIMVSNGIEYIFNTTFELSAVIALGYYNEKPKITKRLSVEEILTFFK